MALSDRQIEELGIISDGFVRYNRDEQLGKISYGTTCYGYDVRLGWRFRVFKPYPCTVIDPKSFDERMLETVDIDPAKSDHLVIPPHSFVLGESIETFKIPRDIICVVVGKSTYCRCGLLINVSPGESEWKGRWTIEISNTTPLPAKVYCGEGIMQALFFRSDEREEAIIKGLNKHLWGQHDDAKALAQFLADASCRESYADKRGKFQNQQGIVLPKVTQ